MSTHPAIDYGMPNSPTAPAGLWLLGESGAWKALVGTDAEEQTVKLLFPEALIEAYNFEVPPPLPERVQPASPEVVKASAGKAD